MSKKLKPKKTVAKTAPKKAVQKVAANKAKPTAKKTAKPISKAVPAKKKAVKVVAKTKVVAKVAPKKQIAKPATKPAKVVAKKIVKPLAKKVVTKTAKVVSKKIVKPIAKKIVAKVAPKKVAKTPAKAVKPVASKPQKAEKPAKVEKVKVAKPAKEEKVKIEKAVKAPKPIKVAKRVLLPTPEAPAEVTEKASKIPSKYKKLEMEFPIHASRYFLYNMFATAAGLSEWFADNVNIRGNFFTFIWDGSEQTAELKAYKEGTYVRFRWLDSPEIYFEFRIETDELTGDVALIVTDFVEDLSSEQSTRLLWISQIENLMRVIGA